MGFASEHPNILQICGKTCFRNLQFCGNIREGARFRNAPGETDTSTGTRGGDQASLSRVPLYIK